MNNTQKKALQNVGRKEVSLAEARDMMYEKFRTNVRLLRAKKGWSAFEAGQVIGLRNGKRMVDLEYGRGNPTMQEMILISDTYKVPIDSLLHKEAQVTFE